MKFGTMNVRGINSNEKKQQLAEDIFRYNVTVMAVQETHIPGQGSEEISTSDGRHKYQFYHTGEDNNYHHGVGIIVNKNAFDSPQFQHISARICTMKAQMHTHGDGCTRNLLFISAYAPNLARSKSNPDTREDFYNQLDKVIRENANRNVLVIGGDFNAKTGSAWREYPKNIGPYGKGEINDNLLDTARKNELLLTNTTFYHQMAHRTTLVCPKRINKHRDKDGNEWRNPYRNQIDYILIHNRYKQLVTKARSYSGMNTSTDHRLVIASVNLQWYKANYERKPTNIKYSPRN